MQNYFKLRVIAPKKDLLYAIPRRVKNYALLRIDRNFLGKVDLANPHSPYSDFHSSLIKDEWIAQKKVHPSKRVNAFTLLKILYDSIK
jgi:hypothetical protein